jgi:hypothetical protein
MSKVKSEKPLVNKKYLLEKYPGKGGWTYAIISEISQDKKAPFGWVKVKGSIDDYELHSYKLMPMGNGKLFLPVKAEIRKKIGKKEGDWVKVVLYLDSSPLAIPEEFIICLKEDSAAYKTFLKYTEGQQKEFIDWIYSAKTEKTKEDRIAVTLNKLAKQQKLRDK